VLIRSLHKDVQTLLLVDASQLLYQAQQAGRNSKMLGGLFHMG
jgi:hypothetical protein